MLSKTDTCSQACYKVQSCKCRNATKELGTWQLEIDELVGARIVTALAVAIAILGTESTVETVPKARALTNIRFRLAKAVKQAWY